ncbi:MAG: divalent cation tolerance protein CutA [Deltaproteobacteria bacterium]|nr:divalent cation tolerance protein CutA [Deltaproteobacteria bacterium]
MYIGWTTVASREDAEKIAREAVQERLVACAQIDGPIRSFYLWQDKLTSDEEYRITFKFLAKNGGKLEVWLKENHPYELPQWVTVQAEHVLAEYLHWAKGNMQSDHKKAIELSRQGSEFLKKRCWKEAENSFLEALEIDSENSYVLVGLGDLHRETGKFHKAIGFYEKTLELDPLNMFALRGVGDSYRGLGQAGKAITFWQRYLEQNSDDIHVLTRLADSYVKMGNFSESETLYLKALSLDGTDKYALRGIGNLYYKLADHDKALAYFEKFIALDDTYIAVLTMAGNIYRRRKQYERAVVFYEKALKQEPWNIFALYGMGDSQRGMRNYEESVSFWLKILEKEPQNQNLHSRVGDALVILGRLDEAITHYQQSMKTGFDQFAVLGMAKACRLKKAFGEAEKHCSQLLEKIPEDERTLSELLALYEDMGEKQKAEEIRRRL